MYNYIGLEPRREAMHWQFGEMKFGEMKRNTSNWSNFGMLLRRAGLTASAGLSCKFYLSLSEIMKEMPRSLHFSCFRMTTCYVPLITNCIHLLKIAK